MKRVREPDKTMSKRRDVAQAAVQAQLKSLTALLQLYKEDFSKTPEDRERLQGLVEQAEALETRYLELIAPRGPRPRVPSSCTQTVSGARGLSTGTTGPECI